ncbi:MAG: hypothetical protein IPQ02_08345 [Saprospiraceae bacterium]|nr:hypothetical protein [Candidatus Defluviibacterium haderslevense]
MSQIKLFACIIFLSYSCTSKRTCEELSKEWRNEKTAFKQISSAEWNRTEKFKFPPNLSSNIITLRLYECALGNNYLIIDRKNEIGGIFEEIKESTGFFTSDVSYYRYYYQNVPIEIWDKLKFEKNPDEFILLNISNIHKLYIAPIPKILINLAISGYIIIFLFTFIRTYIVYNEDKNNDDKSSFDFAWGCTSLVAFFALYRLVCISILFFLGYIQF